jgi:hypothetical protein
VKHLAWLLLVILIFSVALSLYRFPMANAATASRSFAASSSDGYITANGPAYIDAHDTLTGTVYSNALYIGQDKGITPYYVYRGFLFFDTAAIPDSATITSATLSLYVSSDHSTNDFNATLQTGGSTYPHDPLEIGDYYYPHYSSNGGSRNTSEISGTGYWNVTLNSDGINWLSKIGTSKFALLSSRDISNTAPSGAEYVTVYSSEQGESYAPKLYVTYTTSGAYTYNFYGPYVDTGAVFSGKTTCTVYQSYNSTVSFTLDGAGGADTVTYAFEQAAVMVAWNISSGMNYTRTYYFDGSLTEDVYIFMPSLDLPVGLYTFTVTDFRGITNGYLEILTNIGTGTKILTRQPLDSVNPVPCYLSWSVKYQLRLTCTDGTLDLGSFTALTIENTNLIIPFDAFPITYYGLNATVNAARQNDTWIQMNYTDWSELTIWVSTTITHSVGYSTVTDYSDNETSNTVVLNWYSANSDTDYLVTVQAYRDGTTNTYSFICPHTPNESNPWAMLDALLADVNGFPIRPRYIIGLALVLAFVGIFSYAHAVAGAFAGVLSAAFLTVIGWLQIHWVLISFAGAVAMFMAIADFKKTEREV